MRDFPIPPDSESFFFFCSEGQPLQDASITSLLMVCFFFFPFLSYIMIPSLECAFSLDADNNSFNHPFFPPPRCFIVLL